MKSNETKVWHTCTATAWVDQRSLNDAHERCLNELIGKFLTTDVHIETVSVAIIPGADSRGRSSAVVTMIGWKVYDMDVLRQIHAENARYHRECAAREANSASQTQGVTP